MTDFKIEEQLIAGQRQSTGVETVAAKMPPPNPFYKRQYASTVTGGQAWVEIPAPGNEITVEDAKDLIEFLGLIQRQLQRIVDQSQPVV